MELPYNAEILHIIELINIGKGLIPSLTEDNLLSIKEPLPTPERVIPSMSEIIQVSNSNGFSDNYFLLYHNYSKAGISINNYSDFNQFPLLELGVFNYYGGGLDRGFSYYTDKTIYNDSFQRGIEYENIDPLYATLNTLATRGFVLKSQYKHISEYDAVDGIYNVTEEDLGKILIVSATVPITIKLEAFTEFNFEIFNNSEVAVSLLAGDSVSDFNSKANSRTIKINKKGLVKVFNGSFTPMYQIAGDIIYIATTNTTTTALNSSQLNAAYPSVETGFRVQCPNITSGGFVYEKMASGWLQHAIQVVA